jgi:hypothetical protein
MKRPKETVIFAYLEGLKLIGVLRVSLQVCNGEIKNDFKSLLQGYYPGQEITFKCG